jgi:hypothetical protein
MTARTGQLLACTVCLVGSIGLVVAGGTLPDAGWPTALLGAVGTALSGGAIATRKRNP